MKTEWDQVKREWTLRERGLDFASVAAARWEAALTEPDTRTGYGEDRFVSLVPIHGRLCGCLVHAGRCFSSDQPEEGQCQRKEAI